MKSRFLFPYWTKFLGSFFLLCSIPLIVLWQDPAFKITLFLMLSGCLLIAFSKERHEDEHIAQLRLESLQWAIYIVYALIMINWIFLKGNDLLYSMHFYIRFMLPIFIIRFRWVMFKSTRLMSKEA
jgi:hypothetical protein